LPHFLVGRFAIQYNRLFTLFVYYSYFFFIPFNKFINRYFFFFPISCLNLYLSREKKLCSLDIQHGSNEKCQNYMFLIRKTCAVKCYVRFSFIDCRHSRLFTSYSSITSIIVFLLLNCRQVNNTKKKHLINMYVFLS